MRKTLILSALLLVWTAAAGAAAAQTPDVLTPVPCRDLPWEYADPSFQPVVGAKAFYGRYEGGTYQIEVPDAWNGELVLAAHGRRSDTGTEGAIVRGAMPVSVRVREHFVRNGFAWAASSYQCNGSVPGRGLIDTLRLKDQFVSIIGRAPTRHYLIGWSMGGGITLRAMHMLPDMFAGGLAMCPVVSQNRWDFAVEVAAAAQAISGVDAEPATLRESLAQMTAIFGMPGAYTVKGQQLASVQIELSGGPRPFAVEGLAARFMANIDEGLQDSLSVRSGTNALTRYTIDERLGLSATDLNARVPRVLADAILRGPASPYLELSELDGNLKGPVITLHGTGDLQVPISGQRLLRNLVDAAGKGDLLVQRIMRIPGHCAFSAEEEIQAFDDLVMWVKEGKKPEGDDVLADLRDAGRRFTNPLRPGDPGTLTIAADPSSN